MRTWFTADSHFGHANILRLCGRPFSDAEAMDEELVRRWNAVVEDEDEVWHLGDFSYRSGPNRIADLFGRLKGARRHLIIGNHDRSKTLDLPWTSIQHYAEIKIDGIQVVLFHYALRVWNKSHFGSWHLYGHSHGALPAEGRSCDVGVDCWNFSPISFDQVAVARRSQDPGL